VNLDYKLREELREELPQLFLDTGATVIYATTEPLEALLLGGYTANMREGKVTQYAPTHQVFRKPMDLDTAKGFSDPPMNTIEVQKNGNSFLLENQGRWEMPRFASIPDGTYTLGFRPHHLQLSASDKNYVKLSGEVLVTEISGSESFIHLRSVQHDKWSAQIHGIHDLEQGVQIELFLSLKHCLLFDGAGLRVDVN
ncbi:MAG: ABC transporter ATP-binding protein, partial [SAR324 cluster bacterium]|nr:ABC transporter ATP-binding protein [SAR324 cluster bacterium]